MPLTLSRSCATLSPVPALARTERFPARSSVLGQGGRSLRGQSSPASHCFEVEERHTNEYAVPSALLPSGTSQSG